MAEMIESKIEYGSKIECRKILGLFFLFAVLAASSAWSQGMPDSYEDDDTVDTSSVYYLFSTTLQSHGFHDSGDEDWVRFSTMQDFDALEIKTYNPEENCETVITLFDSDKTTQLAEQQFTLSSGVNLMSFRPDNDGTYYVRIKNKDSSNYGENTGYSLSIYFPVAPFSGTVDGIITDSSGGAPVEGVAIRIENDFSATVSESDGFYFLQCPAGQFTLYATKSGYSDYSTVIDVDEAQRTELNIVLEPAPMILTLPTSPTFNRLTSESDILAAPVQVSDASGWVRFSLNIGQYESAFDLYIMIVTPEGNVYYPDSSGSLTDTLTPYLSNSTGNVTATFTSPNSYTLMSGQYSIFWLIRPSGGSWDAYLFSGYDITI